MWDQYATILAYSLPGFLAYAVVYRECIPGRPLSDLQITYRSLLWSVVLDGLAWATTDLRGVQIEWTHPGTVVWLCVAAVISGWSIAILERKYGVQSYLFGLFGFPKAHWPDCWRFAVDLSSEGGGVLYVRLVDGTTYYGVPTYASEHPGDPRELILKDAWIWYPGQEKPEKIGRSVYIAGGAIEAIMPYTSTEIEADAEVEPSRQGEEVHEGEDNEG